MERSVVDGYESQSQKRLYDLKLRTRSQFLGDSLFAHWTH